MNTMLAFACLVLCASGPKVADAKGNYNMEYVKRALLLLPTGAPLPLRADSLTHLASQVQLQLRVLEQLPVVRRQPGRI